MDYFKKLKAKARTGLHRDRTKSTASLSTINSDLVAGSSTAPAESETPPPTPEITAEITPVSTAPCDALPLPFTEPETPPPQPVQERTPVLTTAKNAVEAILYVVAESADAFAPLKSVLGGLRAILDLKEVSLVSDFAWLNLTDYHLEIFWKQGKSCDCDTAS